MDDGVTVDIQVMALLAAAFILIKLVLYDPPKPTRRTVAILVLGDIGRSPRMMYHAESFATSGFWTYLIGYKGSKPAPSLLELSLLRLVYLHDVPRAFRGLPWILLAPIKVIHQITSIYVTLSNLPYCPEYVVVQNPPSIPTLAIVWAWSRLRGSKIVIDWHNLGYTILALKLGMRHPLVKVAKKFESFFGRTAYAHLFVTNAMREYLVKQWDLRGHKAVLHDRPPAHFRRTEPSEVHELFLRLQSLLPPTPSLTSFLPPYSAPYSTPFTHITAAHPAVPIPIPLTPPPELNMPTLRPDRPALVVSSTSWTADEDFSILLSALRRYEGAARKAGQLARARAAGRGTPPVGGLPKVLMVVTGKGPLKEYYMTREEEVQGAWEYVRCVSLWLEAEDYPVLLGAADVGVSLHSSSSALDLPMKVVDMFGCGLPVCALDFSCLHELVKDGVNGLLFRDASQLATQLETLLSGFPNPNWTLDALRSSLTDDAAAAAAPQGPPRALEPGSEDWVWSSWSENWDRVVRPLVLTDAKSPDGGSRGAPG
ncbi:hypothetical protein PUNSTDRAFT_78889 [Punctularia strigosozonata HHB-11173 SS5]|uniref:uncharacterized protein n=1 Tax=Punctularia strigosozonata (strain HHB-11173) TaxID=741275 RepID=UPI0004417A8D|nr:uncharacterized protein PUNSTDRAFT_78889 [Punctularia strigosozonata HHB-11173 SS5]EIN13371.1 hypothetical protein PUNSTDRAFT_78889 [Punctularia strigosozonata HHB-11173 SS5]